MVFLCSSLLDCSCDVPCDYLVPTALADSLQELKSESNEPLILRDAEKEGADYNAVFRYYSAEAHAEATEVAPHRCCVIGCDKDFPPSHPSGWTYIPTQIQFKAAFTVQWLCKMHDNRLRRARKTISEAEKHQVLWISRELQADGRISRTAELRPQDFLKAFELYSGSGCAANACDAG